MSVFALEPTDVLSILGETMTGLGLEYTVSLSHMHEMSPLISVGGLVHPYDTRSDGY